MSSANGTLPLPADNRSLTWRDGDRVLVRAVNPPPSRREAIIARFCPDSHLMVTLQGICPRCGFTP